MPGGTGGGGMHEASIMEALLETAREEMNRAGGCRILRIEVTVGVLSGVNAEALRFAFRMLAPGTPAQGAELALREARASCRFGSCGKTSLVDDPFAPCPACGSVEVEIRGGDELLLSSLDVEDREEAGGEAGAPPER